MSADEAHNIGKESEGQCVTGNALHKCSGWSKQVDATMERPRFLFQRLLDRTSFLRQPAIVNSI